MTASELKTRRLFAEGCTTKDSLRPHLSVSDQTIQTYLSRIRDDLQKEQSGSLTGFLATKAESVVVSQLDTLEGRLEDIQSQIEGLTSEDKVYIPLLKQEASVMRDIRKLSGADLILELRSMRAIEDFNEKPVIPPIQASKNVFIPDCGNARKIV